MTLAQRNWLDGHTIAELCVLLTDLEYNTNNLITSKKCRDVGVTPNMVAHMLVHRTAFSG